MPEEAPVTNATCGVAVIVSSRSLDYVRTTIRGHGFESKTFRKLKLWSYSQRRARRGPPAGRTGEGACGAVQQGAQAGDAAADHLGHRFKTHGIDGSGIAMWLADAGLTRTNRPHC